MSNLPACHFFPSEVLEREAHRREDGEWLDRQLSNSPRFIFVWRGNNLFSVGRNKRPLALEVPDPEKVINPIFLGIQGEGAPLFAANLSDPQSEQDALALLYLNTDLARFIPLRQFDGLLSSEERALLFYSRSLTHWHEEQKFCHRCAHPTLPEQGGHILACANPDCATKHFPRTDPATIMLIHSGDLCLLGRQASWPEGMYSTLAGFVEPGEKLEDAVFREVKEESGIEVKNIRYFGSQPWPFPQSLMLGFFAEANSKQIIRGAELEDVRWFQVSEAREMLVKLASRFPHLDTIARRLIRHWVEASM
ncbi:MAG: NAD(+) diphosphatase [Verrucomicrobia bacterium]|nr:NAD(+) diphosphatase [Verrucomicrobiota bacterium]MBV9298070.1 NAD(+) diphosphatase [Verrucomicrobiota bacterium]MBV9644093.1 NAD(+) diphosphatase [Verrucomicrobiota bacterium]